MYINNIYCIIKIVVIIVFVVALVFYSKKKVRLRW